MHNTLFAVSPGDTTYTSNRLSFALHRHSTCSVAPHPEKNDKRSLNDGGASNNHQTATKQQSETAQLWWCLPRGCNDVLLLLCCAVRHKTAVWTHVHASQSTATHNSHHNHPMHAFLLCAGAGVLPTRTLALSLPPELLQKVLSLLSQQDRVRGCGRVSRAWQQAAAASSSQILARSVSAAKLESLLQYLHNHGQRVSEKKRQLLQLTSLNMQGFKITEPAVRHLSRLSRLQAFKVYSGRTNSESLNAFFDGRPVPECLTPKAAAAICLVAQLTSLSLHGVHDIGIMPGISSLTTLQRLSIDGCILFDESLLAPLTGLKTVWLQNVAIRQPSDAFLQSLAQLQRLESCEMQSCVLEPATTAHYSALTASSKLQRLEWIGNHIRLTAGSFAAMFGAPDRQLTALTRLAFNTPSQHILSTPELQALASLKISKRSIEPRRVTRALEKSQPRQLQTLKF